MNTEQVIRALVDKHEFVLPDGVERVGSILGTHPSNPLRWHQMCDLCAIGFARQAKARVTTDPADAGDAWDNYHESLLEGDSATALAALLEIMEAK